MKTLATIFAWCAALAAGCASKQARKVTPSGFLGSDGELLRQGEKGQALLTYTAPNIRWNDYHNVLLEPVEYWTDPNGKKQLPEKDRKMLTDYLYGDLEQALAKRWKIVQEPGPGTIRLKAAIVEAKKSRVALDVISSIVPQAFVLSSLKNGVTGKPSGVGEVQGEIKALDSQSGELLGEAVDRRIGKKKFGGKFSRWDDVESALRYWSTQVAFRLCVLQGGTDCEGPTEAKP